MQSDIPSTGGDALTPIHMANAPFKNSSKLFLSPPPPYPYFNSSTLR
jgi:hypothetical protein